MLVVLMLKSLLRNKWNMVKLFIISPINSVLPVVLLGNAMSSNINQNTILKICLWSCFYFSIFEIVSRRVEFFGSEKIQDVFSSKITLQEYNLYQTISVNVLYIPSILITMAIYNIIFHLEMNLFFSLGCAFLVFVNNIIISNIMLAVHLKSKNYFNAFNFGIDIIYIICGILYPISILPFIFKYIAMLIPLTYVIDFSSENTLNLGVGILVTVLMMLVSNYSIKTSLKKYIDEGGFYG